mmetsp:Transcript_3756/g.5500  ORF Transcript_3756/g.5500 Transcript_3756/m.5500 type:complete len:560 (-) Transcript_3756:129-1808(-)
MGSTICLPVNKRFVEDNSSEEDPITNTPIKRRRPLGQHMNMSLLRVNSRRQSSEDGEQTPFTPNERASTYDHVRDAVLHNFNEAGVLNGSIPAGVVGLRNLGNTCFMNSSLQCLSNTIPLTDYFLGYDYHKEVNKNNFLGTGGQLATAYAELMKDMWLQKGKNGTIIKNDRLRIVPPSCFKKSLSKFAPQFSGYSQHDAQELLSYLLDGIHEDLNRVKKRPYIEDKDCDGTNDENDAAEAWKNYLSRNKSLIVDLFQGQFRNTCICKECNHKNIRFEPSMYLSLPISDSCRTLEDCLDLFLEEDTLTGDNQWYCEKCKCHTDATKKTDLWVLPPILIVHLKRFTYNDFGRAVSGQKNDVALKYPLKQFDLSRKVKSIGGGTPVYDLYAVSNHLGGTGSGHYTAYALNRFDNAWYEFNDSSYQKIDPVTTFETSSSPYVLFYNRVAPAAAESAASDSSLGQDISGRIPLIRRQSISRPDLWPHSQVREGHFREFERSVTDTSDSKIASNARSTNGGRTMVTRSQTSKIKKKMVRDEMPCDIRDSEMEEDDLLGRRSLYQC